MRGRRERDVPLADLPMLAKRPGPFAAMAAAAAWTRRGEAAAEEEEQEKRRGSEMPASPVPPLVIVCAVRGATEQRKGAILPESRGRTISRSQDLTLQTVLS